MARIGGLFPFPLRTPGSGGGEVVLVGGGTYTFPPGNFLVCTGSQTNVQWFDPNEQQWRNVMPTVSDVIDVSSDGCNYRLMNMSGVVVGASITNAGSGGTNGIGSAATGVVVSFSNPAVGGALLAATGYAIVGGSVQAPTINQGGTGFVMPPLVLVDAPPVGGIQATAVATVSSAGVVTAITMVNVGAGYTASPNFYVIPQIDTYQGSMIAGIPAGIYPPPGTVYPTNLPPGSPYEGNKSPTGCQLTSNALTGSGTLTGIGIIQNGVLYDGTHIPTITITGCGAAAATAVMSMALQSVALGAGGSGYTGAAPMWETSLGLVLQSFNNAITVPRPARGVATVGGGAVASFVIEDNGFGFQKVPTVSVINAGGLATGQATGTAVVGGVNDTSIVQQAVE
jgi:hypothetical protein